MTSMAEDLIGLLGKPEDGPDVARAIGCYSLIELGSIATSARRSVGSREHGIELCFEEGRVEELEIHVEPYTYEIDKESPLECVSAYPDALPFGLVRKMNKERVVGVLKEQERKEGAHGAGGRYVLCGGNVLVIPLFRMDVLSALTIRFRGEGSLQRRIDEMNAKEPA